MAQTTLAEQLAKTLEQAGVKPICGVAGDSKNGLSLYPLKAVINGRGDEVIELAKTNLRR